MNVKDMKKLLKELDDDMEIYFIDKESRYIYNFEVNFKECPNWNTYWGSLYTNPKTPYQSPCYLMRDCTCTIGSMHQREEDKKKVDLQVLAAEDSSHIIPYILKWYECYEGDGDDYEDDTIISSCKVEDIPV